MERSSIEHFKSLRAQYYASKNRFDKAAEIIDENNRYKPVFNPRELHPEEEPSLEELNSLFQDIATDIDIIETNLIGGAGDIQYLMENTVSRLQEIDKDLQLEDERLKDLNMLCGKNSEFDISRTLTAADFDGNFSEENGVFTAEITGEVIVPCTVESVHGNGYEGNDYVYKDGSFLKETFDTSNRTAMVDMELTSFYEYSRINADRSEKVAFPLVNFDNIEAECSIVLRAEKKINKIVIHSNLDHIIVKEVSISDDGDIFRPVIEGPIEINNTDNKYSNGSNYIYGSGLLCFPSTQYVKVTLESGGHTDDKIAFEFLNSNM